MPKIRDEYRLSPEAENDLESIWSYTSEEWGLQQANHYTDQLIAGFTNLASQPQRGQDVNYIHPGYRRHRLGRHSVYYRITEHGIAIIRILHERMSPLPHLSEPENIE